MNHMCNKHEGHSSIYPKCDHGELSQDRQWLEEGIYIKLNVPGIYSICLKRKTCK